jgi:hypothetical protein
MAGDADHRVVDAQLAGELGHPLNNVGRQGPQYECCEQQLPSRGVHDLDDTSIR